MNDFDVLKQIEDVVGRPVPHRLDSGDCVALSLAIEEAPFHGLIRHLTPEKKMDVMKLVSKLEQLRTLDLRRNRLFVLPQEFNRLKNLEYLNLGSSYLGMVPDQIRGFSKLKSLHLGNNDLTELPGFLAELTSLEYVALHKNIKLKVVDSLRGLTNLRGLNLYFVNLFSLPEFFYEFSNLKTLSLWNVSQFPFGLESFSELEFFTNCGGPRIRELPQGFTQLKCLRMARLYQNNIESLPDDMGNLKNLEQISLYQNQLTHLPDSMANLSLLTKLNLGWNHFEALPSWLNNFKNLEWLGVFGNPLEEVNLKNKEGLKIDLQWPFSTVS